MALDKRIDLSVLTWRLDECMAEIRLEPRTSECTFDIDYNMAIQRKRNRGTPRSAGSMAKAMAPPDHSFKMYSSRPTQAYYTPNMSVRLIPPQTKIT